MIEEKLKGTPRRCRYPAYRNCDYTMRCTKLQEKDENDTYGHHDVNNFSEADSNLLQNYPDADDVDRKKARVRMQHIVKPPR